MYTPDIVSLRHFYATAFGELTRTLIEKAILRRWPDANCDVMVGLGYATPYLSAYLGQATPLAVVMPASQGAVYWPPEGDNLVAIAHDSELPFTESSVNRVLLVHSMENSEQLSLMIQEIWRILTPSGRLLAVVPNRRGLWSVSPRSPFGYGRPFSIAQLRHLLTEQNFTVTHTDSTLFVPPTSIKCLWRIANKLEAVGSFICRSLGGVILIEAEKQIYSTIRQPVVEARNYRGTFAGARTAMNMEKKLP